MALGTQGLEGELGLENTNNNEGFKWNWWDGDDGDGLVDEGIVQVADNGDGSTVLADSSAASSPLSSLGFDQSLFEDDAMYLPSPSFDNGLDSAVG